MIGDERQGDNLYSDSVVALDVKTGRASGTSSSRRTTCTTTTRSSRSCSSTRSGRGRPRKLLVQANRNGYFYVLDRTTGEYLLGTQYVKNVTWASGLTPDGRPIVVPNMEPTPEGRRVCPSLEGRVELVLRVVQPADRPLLRADQRQVRHLHARGSAVGARARASWAARLRPRPSPRSACLRAIDIQTGKVAWELPQFGAVDSWGGVLSTAGDVVFFCDDSGAFAAADARSGKAALELPDQPGVEVVADDLPVRQSSVRGRGVRPEHPRVRAAGRCPVNPGRGSLDEIELHAVTGIPERQALGRRLRRIRARHEIAHVVTV